MWALLLGAAGCVVPGDTIEYPAGGIAATRITVLQPPPVERYALLTLFERRASATVPFLGVAGAALVALSTWPTRSERLQLTDLMTERLDLPGLLARGVAQRLQATGLCVDVVQGAWAEDERFLISADTADSEATLVLLPQATGFAERDQTGAIEPMLAVRASLVQSVPHRTVYRRVHAVGPFVEATPDARRLRPPDAFPLDALLDDPDRAADALRLSAQAVVESIARDLAVRPPVGDKVPPPVRRCT